MVAGVGRSRQPTEVGCSFLDMMAGYSIDGYMYCLIFSAALMAVTQLDFWSFPYGQGGSYNQSVQLNDNLYQAYSARPIVSH